MGRLRDLQFCERRNFLVCAVNSIGCDAYGIAKDLCEVYPHERVYTSRTSLYHLSRAVIGSRDPPGALVAQEAPEGEDLPYLIACVAQYGWGSCIDDNVKARRAVEASQDHHYVEGLKEDTSENRLRYFKTCMKKLATLAMGNKDVEKIILTERIGCRGKAGEEWKNPYIPVIQALAVRMKPFGIQTIVARLPEKKLKYLYDENMEYKYNLFFV